MTYLKLEPVIKSTKTFITTILISIICALIGVGSAKAQLGIEQPGLIPLSSCDTRISADSTKVCNDVHLGDITIAASLNEARLMFTYGLIGLVTGLLASLLVSKQNS